MTTTTAPEERIARMEGQIEHMATKADIGRVRADLSGDIGRVRADIERQSAMLTWRMIIVAGIAQAIGIGALLQFLPRP